MVVDVHISSHNAKKVNSWYSLEKDKLCGLAWIPADCTQMDWCPFGLKRFENNDIHVHSISVIVSLFHMLKISNSQKKRTLELCVIYLLSITRIKILLLSRQHTLMNPIQITLFLKIFINASPNSNLPT